MEAETGENVDTGWSICSGEKRNVGLVESLDDVELVLDEFLPDGKRIGIEVFYDSGRKFGPAFLAPEHGRIFTVRILRDVNRVNQPLSALPVKSGALPGLIFCE